MAGEAARAAAVGGGGEQRHGGDDAGAAVSGGGRVAAQGWARAVRAKLSADGQDAGEAPPAQSIAPAGELS
jgi:hypothetical protein